MALEGGRTNVRLCKGLTSNIIAEVLNDSEFDCSGDDTDEDPEINQTIRDHAQSESSSSSEDEDDLVTSVASPTVSDNSDSPSTSSYLLRARGRARRTSHRQSCGRSRGRGESSQLISPRQIAIRTRQYNAGIQDTWVHETLDSKINSLMQPAYINKSSNEWEWYQFYEQYVDDDILNCIVTCTNRTQVLETEECDDEREDKYEELEPKHKKH
ncbi:unnamed protein product [Parnassius apollo]|uniref:(apollo) hypothetical protein n=1 Tax=Parnassius apollo TaxID=110799 RepID=A0A8S3XRV4_PARAO|nr:unnamed protein product [Parnassius apollo]